MKKLTLITLGILMITSTAQAGVVGDMFDRLITRFGADVNGKKIISVRVEPNKNHIRLLDEATGAEVGILQSDDESYIFYWEQTNSNAQPIVDTITG
jgi:hypothetical protein